MKKDISRPRKYVCGDNWTIREISASEGYLLDDTVYSVGAEAKNYTVEKNTVKMTVKEDVIKGKISIIKHSDDGTTQIETPEQGAEFEVYLKSSGSYENAKDSEKDHLVCDKNGFDETKFLHTVFTLFIRLRAGKTPNGCRILKWSSARMKRIISTS